MTKVRKKTEYFDFPLRTIREELGLTLRELAEKVGCSYTHLSYCEAGRQALSEDLWEKIREVMKGDERLNVVDLK